MLSSECSNIPFILDVYECMREEERAKEDKEKEAERTSQKNGREGFRGTESRRRNRA